MVVWSAGSGCALLRSEPLAGVEGLSCQGCDKTWSTSAQSIPYRFNRPQIKGLEAFIQHNAKDKPHTFQAVTAYDDLATYQFKSGKAYDKRSVEEFRAAALTALDDVLRHNIQIEDQLAGAHPVEFQAALAAAPSHSVEEQELLDLFSAMNPFDRFEFLQRASGSSVTAVPAKPASQPVNEQPGVGWNEPDGWSDTPPSPDAFSRQTPPAASSPVADAGLSFDAWTPQATYAPIPSVASPALPTGVAEPQKADASSPTYEPDWLSEWESAVPEGDTPASTGSNGWDSAPDFASPASPVDWASSSVDTQTDEPSNRGEPAQPTAGDSFTWNEPAATINALDWNEPTRQPWTQDAAIDPPASVTPSGSFDPWRAEVGIPEQADVVESFGNGSVGEVPYNDERLEALFNQLDFGPPSADLLSPSSTDPIAAAQNHQGSPLRVEETRSDGQPLPPPVRPWEGWIR